MQTTNAATVSYVDYLRNRAISLLSNTCHDPATGRFCEKAGSPGQGLTMPTWPDQEDKRRGLEVSKATVSGINRSYYKGAALWAIERTDPNEVASIKETLDSISRVHTLPEDFPGAMVLIQSSGMGAADGIYSAELNQIKMAEGALSQRGRFTFVHEFGHHLTMHTGTSTVTHFLGQINKQGLGDVVTAITHTDAIKRISNTATTATKTPDQENTKRYAQYLLSPHESFARAYAQYIATRSGDPQLRDQFERARFQGDSNDFQWTDTDFQPISDAFDEYFATHRLTAAAFLPLWKIRKNELSNDCHSPEDGRFCETPGGTALLERPKLSKKVEPATKAKYSNDVEAVFTNIPADQLEGQAFLDALPPGVKGGQDLLLKQVRTAQGFDVLPQVVSQATFDKAPGQAFYRGIGGPRTSSYSDQYRYGDYYAGYGVFGDGDYFTTSGNTAKSYADGYPRSHVIQAKLRPGARIISYDEIAELHDQAREHNVWPLRDNPATATKLLKVNRQYDDIGVLAAALGYDAIRVDSPKIGAEKYFVVLNRGAVVVSEEDLT